MSSSFALLRNSVYSLTESMSGVDGSFSITVRSIQFLYALHPRALIRSSALTALIPWSLCLCIRGSPTPKKRLLLMFYSPAYLCFHDSRTHSGCSCSCINCLQFIFSRRPLFLYVIILPFMVLFCTKCYTEKKDTSLRISEGSCHDQS